MRVTFCGHKDVDDWNLVKRWVMIVCRELIMQGADEFFLGGYGGFDLLCASVLQQLKEESPRIRLVLVLPYLQNNMDIDGYDETVYPPLESVPKRFAISKRNEWMVQQSDILVAYVIHSWGGASKTLEYARRKKKRIITYE